MEVAGEMSARLTLLNFSIFDKDAMKGKLTFKLEGFSHLIRHQMTKSFKFGGNYWKLQVSKKFGYFGMFVRWYGTSRPFSNQTIPCSCVASTRFTILNKVLPDDSISQGSSKVGDTYDIIGGGVGYSRIERIERLSKTRGYVINNTLYMQVSLDISHTKFSTYIPCRVQPGSDYTQGIKFSFYGSNWNIILYPDGENGGHNIIHKGTEARHNINDKETKGGKELGVYSCDNSSSGDSDIESNRSRGEEVRNDDRYACLYLMRESDSVRQLLRHNVQVSIAIGDREIKLDHHFHAKNANAIGSASFMPAAELKRMIQSRVVLVTIKFIAIVPYFYFSYKVKDDELSDGFIFNDHYQYPWKFKLTWDPHTHMLKGIIELDPKNNSERVKSFLENGKVMEVCWFVEILSPHDIYNSLTFNCDRKKWVKDAFFCTTEKKDVVNFSEPITKVLGESNGFLDADGNLCVLVSILCCNFVDGKGDERYL